MSLTTVLAIYFLIWWLTLFAVLPWGVRNSEEAGAALTPGSDPGAPALHVMGWKVLWTTLIASVIFAALYVAYTRSLLPFDWLKGIVTPPRTY
jgi:predicted secreted protein